MVFPSGTGMNTHVAIPKQPKSCNLCHGVGSVTRNSARARQKNTLGNPGPICECWMCWENCVVTKHHGRICQGWCVKLRYSAFLLQVPLEEHQTLPKVGCLSSSPLGSPTRKGAPRQKEMTFDILGWYRTSQDVHSLKMYEDKTASEQAFVGFLCGWWTRAPIFRTSTWHNMAKRLRNQIIQSRSKILQSLLTAFLVKLQGFHPKTAIGLARK